MHYAPILVQGLAFGDEGKGTTIDALAQRHQARAVVRFNGGPQAAHHVVRSDGAVHCFAQFGAATLRPGVQTFLARSCLVDPLAILRENQALQRLQVHDALERLTLSPQSVVVTPLHKHLNRLQEDLRGDARHGSCGLGVGQAQLDAENPALPTLRMGDLRDPQRALRTLRLLQMVKVDQAEQALDRAPHSEQALAHLEALRHPGLPQELLEAYQSFLRHSGARLAEPDHLEKLLQQPAPLLFEGAQGTLLDRDHGFWPHVTPSRTTFQEALRLLAELPVAPRPTRLAVLRAYGTRHGAGPFVTYDAHLTQEIPDLHNAHGRWQGAFRVGWLDAVAARYALALTQGADRLALTCLDRLEGLPQIKICDAYRCQGVAREDLDRCTTWTPEGDQARITALKPAPGFDPEHMGLLTRILRRCQPVYTHLEGWPQARDPSGRSLSAPAMAFVEAVQERLHVSVELISTGARAEDKLWLR